MKLWVDDVRPASEGYIHCKSVNDVKYFICYGARDGSKPYGLPNKYINNIVCDNPGFLVWVDDTIGKFLYENGLLISKNKRKVKK